MESLLDGVHVIGTDGRILFENQAAMTMLGYGENALVGRLGHESIHHHHRDGASYQAEDCPIHLTLTDGVGRAVRGEAFWRKDGSALLVDYQTMPLLDRDGCMYGVSVVFKDATLREHAERTERATHALAEAAYVSEGYGELLERAMRAVASVISIQGLQLWVADEKGGMSRRAGVGTIPTEDDVLRLLSLRDQHSAGAGEHRLASVTQEWLGSSLYCTRTPVGFVAMHRTSSSPALTENELELLVFAVTQIALGTSRLNRQEGLQYAAQHDALTDLPNRTLLQDRIKAALAQASRRGENVAVAYLDLNGFKPVNDSLGHHAGDELLRQVAARLKHVVRDSDTVARVGGDEFVALLTQIAGRESAERVVEKLGASLEQPFDLNGKPVRIGASIGLAIAPDDGATPDELLKSADAEMYRTKRLSRPSPPRGDACAGCSPGARS